MKRFKRLFSTLLAVGCCLTAIPSIAQYSNEELGTTAVAPAIPMASATNPLAQNSCYVLNGNVAYAADCVNWSSTPGSAQFTLALPTGACVVKAFVYYDVMSSQAAAPGGSPVFNGTAVTPTQVTTLAGSPCFPQSRTGFFRLDVTAEVNVPTTAYSVTGLPNNGGCQFGGDVTTGASLFVIYALASEPARVMCIYEGGAISNGSNEFMDQTMTLPVAANGTETILYTSISNGQLTGGGELYQRSSGGLPATFTPVPDPDPLDGDACTGQSCIGQTFWDNDQIFDLTPIGPTSTPRFRIQIISDCLTYGAYVIAARTDAAPSANPCATTGDCDLTAIEAKLDAIEPKLDAIEAKADTIDGKVDSLEAKGDSLESKADSLEGKLDAMQAEFDIIKAMLCNVIRLEHTPNGQRVTTDPVVFDECGTTYTWNGESSCGPQPLPTPGLSQCP